jgi:hypothetical protein
MRQRILCRELPVYFGANLVAARLPGGNFLAQLLRAADAPINTLSSISATLSHAQWPPIPPFHPPAASLCKVSSKKPRRLGKDGGGLSQYMRHIMRDVTLVPQQIHARFKGWVACFRL